MNKKTKLVYMSVGDDGGGPFAFARGIARGLLSRAGAHGRNINLIIEGWKGDNPSRDRSADTVSSLSSTYNQQPEFIPRDRWIWLERSQGTQWVDPVATKSNVLRNFRAKTDNYIINPPKKLSDADLVISVIDPCVIAAARQQGKAAICITDHLPFA